MLFKKSQKNFTTAIEPWDEQQLSSQSKVECVSPQDHKYWQSGEKGHCVEFNIWLGFM